MLMLGRRRRLWTTFECDRACVRDAARRRVGFIDGEKRLNLRWFFSVAYLGQKQTASSRWSLFVLTNEDLFRWKQRWKKSDSKQQWLKSMGKMVKKLWIDALQIKVAIIGPDWPPRQKVLHLRLHKRLRVSSGVGSRDPAGKHKETALQLVSTFGRNWTCQAWTLRYVDGRRDQRRWPSCSSCRFLICRSRCKTLTKLAPLLVGKVLVDIVVPFWHRVIRKPWSFPEAGFCNGIAPVVIGVLLYLSAVRLHNVSADTWTIFLVFYLIAISWVYGQWPKCEEASDALIEKMGTKAYNAGLAERLLVVSKHDAILIVWISSKKTLPFSVSGSSVSAHQMALVYELLRSPMLCLKTDSNAHFWFDSGKIRLPLRFFFFFLDFFFFFICVPLFKSTLWSFF